MALPHALKLFNVYGDGHSFIDVCLEITLPKLAIKTEDYQGAGMISPVSVDLGLEKIEIEHTYGGFVQAIAASFGSPKHDVAMLRFVGSYTTESTGEATTVEVVVRGRHIEIDPGKAKPTEKTKWKVKTACTYYKLTVDGKIWAEIDIINHIYHVMGNDRLAQHQKNIGL